MTFFEQFFSNTIFLTAAFGWLVAQVLKTLIHLIVSKKFVAGSFEFAISLILAIIVMYDAMGVRRETGIQAQVLNEMLKVFEDMGRSEISAHDKLKEFVGHTPLQVLMGALLGILCGVVIYSFLL